MSKDVRWQFRRRRLGVSSPEEKPHYMVCSLLEPQEEDCTDK
jgi:hypothetical protein